MRCLPEDLGYLDRSKRTSSRLCDESLLATQGRVLSSVVCIKLHQILLILRESGRSSSGWLFNHTQKQKLNACSIRSFLYLSRRKPRTPLVPLPPSLSLSLFLPLILFIRPAILSHFREKL